MDPCWHGQKYEWGHICYYLLKLLALQNVKLQNYFKSMNMSYKSEYTVMGPCVVIVRQWILKVKIGNTWKWRDLVMIY